MTDQPPVFLVGFMGAGKSTLGRKLARLLQSEFIDLDEEIMRLAGKTISQIFADQGEPHFRQLERQALAGLLRQKNLVVATGGGAPCFFNQMQLMNDAGLTVYLKISPAALAQRLKAGKTKRPLIKDMQQAELLDYIGKKLEEREPVYNQAKLVVEALNLNAEKLLGYLEPQLK